MVALVCDGCGRKVEVATSPGGGILLPAGWHEGPQVVKEGKPSPHVRAHACPDCRVEAHYPPEKKVARA